MRSPPRIAESILTLFYRGEAGKELAGDLEEEYRFLAAARGPGSARRWYWWQAVRSVAVRLCWARRPRAAEPRLGRRRRPALGILTAVRSLVRAPGVTLLVIVTLGAAFGASISVFGLLDRLVLRPLPIEDPAALVIVNAPSPPVPYLKTLTTSSRAADGMTVHGASYPFYELLRDRVPVFAATVAQRRTIVAMKTGADPFESRGVLVTGNYFKVLGVGAALGRTLTPDDERVHEVATAVVLSHGFWTRHFGGDWGILGRTIQLNQHASTIVGVAAEGFVGTGVGEAINFFAALPAADLISPGGPFRYDSPQTNIYTVMARLADDVDVSSAEETANAVYRTLLAEAIREVPGFSDRRRFYAAAHVTLMPGGYASSQQSPLSRSLTDSLWLLTAMVGLVFLVAAGNVSNLMLGRGTARAREIAVRKALGATRARLLGDHLTETAMLVAVAAGFGLLLAHWSVALLPTLLGVDVLPTGVTSAPDHRAWIATGLLSVVAGAGMWAGSAFRITRPEAGGVLTSAASLSGAPATQSWRRGLVGTQVALSVVLLCGAAVLVRSLANLTSVETGFVADGVQTFMVRRPASEAPGSKAAGVLEALREGLAGLPAVSAVSMTSQLPLAGGGSGTWVVGDDDPAGEPATLTNIVVVGPNFLSTLGMPLLAGRDFTTADRAGRQTVAIVNESLARALFGTADAVGRHLGYQHKTPDMEVVGVARDRPNRSIRSPAEPELYVSLLQDPGLSRVSFVVRAQGTLTYATARAALSPLSPDWTVTAFSSLSDLVSDSLSRDRMLAWLSGAFAFLASLLAVAGVFGLTTVHAQRRTREIGVRLALGATVASIHRLLLREIAVVASLGALAGLTIFVLMSGYLGALLFDLSPVDPVTLGIATAALVGVSFFAGTIPVSRATRGELSRALRVE